MTWGGAWAAPLKDFMSPYRRAYFPRRVKVTLWVLGFCAAVPLAMWAANAIYQVNKQ